MAQAGVSTPVNLHQTGRYVSEAVLGYLKDFTNMSNLLVCCEMDLRSSMTSHQFDQFCQDVKLV